MRVGVDDRDRGRTVVDAARVAGGDRAALGAGRNAGRSRASRVDGQAGPRPLVATYAADRHHLGVEAAGVRGGDGQGVRAGGVRVLALPRHPGLLAPARRRRTPCRGRRGAAGANGPQRSGRVERGGATPHRRPAPRRRRTGPARAPTSTAARPEPHCRSTVSPGTSTGRPGGQRGEPRDVAAGTGAVAEHHVADRFVETGGQGRRAPARPGRRPARTRAHRRRCRSGCAAPRRRRVTRAAHAVNARPAGRRGRRRRTPARPAPSRSTFPAGVTGRSGDVEPDPRPAVARPGRRRAVGEHRAVVLGEVRTTREHGPELRRAAARPRPPPRTPRRRSTASTSASGDRRPAGGHRVGAAQHDQPAVGEHARGPRRWRTPSASRRSGPGAPSYPTQRNGERTQISPSRTDDLDAGERPQVVGVRAPGDEGQLRGAVVVVHRRAGRHRPVVQPGGRAGRPPPRRSRRTATARGPGPGRRG